LVKTALVENEIEAGRRVLEAIDASRIAAPASLWFYYPRAEEWRLVIATPLVRQKGLKAAYLQILKALKRTNLSDDVPLRRISLLDPGDPLIKVLRRLVKTGGQMSNIRLVRGVVNGIPIEGAHIYRMS